MEEEDEAATLLAGMSGSKFEDYDDVIFKNIKKGVNHSWDKKPKDRNNASDVKPQDWLEMQIREHRSNPNADSGAPTKSDGSHFETEDLHPDQQHIAFKVLEKNHEFLTCSDLSKFKPLRCTMNGQGGTGKSVLMNTFTSILRTFGGVNDVVHVAAPTGTAAFNVNGETVHSLCGQGDDCQLGEEGEGTHECKPPHCKWTDNKATLKGRQVFKELAKRVFKLPKVRRLSEKRTKDIELLDRIRVAENVLDEDVTRLQNLHLTNIKLQHGAVGVEKIKEKAIYLFFTNKKRAHHNLSHLSKLNSESNPTAILKPSSASSKHGKGVRSHFKKGIAGASLLCVDSKVCLKDRNFLPLWGLHNGACGTVEEIVFSEGNNPNAGDLLDYVVVNFPLHRGPVWDRDNPQTIHKFQGLSAGPAEDGKPAPMCECVIIDPENKSVEQTQTGLFYTAISRGTALGDVNGLNSAVYFTGDHLTTERIQKLTKCMTKDEEYVKVKKRKHWVAHLNRHTEINHSIESAECKSSERWNTSRLQPPMMSSTAESKPTVHANRRERAADEPGLVKSRNQA